MSGESGEMERLPINPKLESLAKIITEKLDENSLSENAKNSVVKFKEALLKDRHIGLSEAKTADGLNVFEGNFGNTSKEEGAEVQKFIEKIVVDGVNVSAHYVKENITDTLGKNVMNSYQTVKYRVVVTNKNE